MASETAVCPKCGSKDLIPNLRIVDLGQYNSENALHVKVQRRPRALMFKQTYRAKLRATICGRCGAVELSVENAAALLEAFRASQSAG